MLAIAAALALGVLTGCGGDDRAELAEQTGAPPATSAQPGTAGAGTEGERGPDGDAPAGEGAEDSGAPGSASGSSSGSASGGSGGSGSGGSGPSGSGADGPASGASGDGGSRSGSGAGGGKPAVGQKLPQSPPRQQQSGDIGPVLEISGTRCSPRTIEVAARKSLTVRNNSGRSATFEIPKTRTDVSVPKRSAMQVLLPPGRHAFVCRVGDRRTSGSVTVERPGG